MFSNTNKILTNGINSIAGRMFLLFLMLAVSMMSTVSAQTRQTGANKKGSTGVSADDSKMTDGGDLIVERVYPLDKTGGQFFAPNAPSVVDANSLYSNVTNFAGQGVTGGGAAADPAAAANTITRLVADDLTLIRSLNIIGYRFSVVNFDAAAISARPRIRFYAADGTGGGPGTYLGGNSFNAISFPAGSVNVFSTGTLATPITNTNIKIWAGITFDNNSGATGATAAQLNNLGQGVFSPVDKGSSADNYFITTTNGSFLANNPAGTQTNFNGNPVGNFGWEILSNAPTAAHVSLGGKVLTSAGKGLANARVTLTNGSGQIRTMSTNSFGNFKFDDVAAGETVIISASAKQFTFAPQVISVTENVSGLMFTGQP